MKGFSVMWCYGECHGAPARRHRITGEVQFILWKAGEQGHRTDFWYAMHRDHWSGFTTTSKKPA